MRYGQRMGRTVWGFWLDEREAHRIPSRTYQRLMDGDDALPALANRTVPIVEAVLEIHKREVLALVGIMRSPNRAIAPPDQHRRGPLLHAADHAVGSHDASV